MAKADDKDKAAEAPKAQPAPHSEPQEFPMSADEFVRTHERGREVEMKAGFRAYAIQQGWHALAPLTEWKTRYEAFRNRPVA
jgi:hypothetical protein